MSIKDNIEKIQLNIKEACEKSDREPDRVKVIAVTKYVSVETAQEAVNTGVLHLGENRDDGFLHKYEHVDGNVQWHFIGTLQSRKVKSIIGKIDYIHSLDRMSLAKEIQKRSEKVVDCFIQVNVSGEESKHGIDPSEVMSFVKQVSQYDRVRIIGLMTMAPHIQDEERLRGIFREMKVIQQDVQSHNLSSAPCSELSMGMSNDYKLAVEEGATYVRIGTSLVGNEM